MSEDNNHVPEKVFALSSIVVLLLFIWQGSKGFNLSDEGFLWYGVQRVMLGEIPIRDFMSYDPGRYYWSAALMSIGHANGIMSLRAAAAIFQAVGLFVGVLSIAETRTSARKSSLIFWVVSAVILAVWMFPRHKLFDASLSILLIWILTYLVRRPVSRSYFIAGLCVGLVAVFGRNHGIYGVTGSLGIMLWLCIRRTSGPTFLRGLVLWSSGVVLGFAPVLVMAVFAPGFSVAFWESIRFVFKQQATNLALPVPWPWTVGSSPIPFGDAVRRALVGVFFLGSLVFCAVSIPYAFARKLKAKPVPAPFIASAFLAIPYAHFAFSRADVAHLAQGMFPMLVGSLALLSTVKAKIKWPLTIGLCAASLWVMSVFHPGWQCQASGNCVDVDVSGTRLRVDLATANDIALLRRLAEQYAPNGRPFIVTPFWPGAYPLLGRRSPMWDSYAIFPQSERFEKEQIEHIKSSNPGFVLVLDLPLDGRDELRFMNTHPLTYRYILDNFEAVLDWPTPAYQIFRARSVGQ